MNQVIPFTGLYMVEFNVDGLAGIPHLMPNETMAREFIAELPPGASWLISTWCAGPAGNGYWRFVAMFDWSWV